MYSGLIEYIVHTREKKHLFGLLMNGKFTGQKAGTAEHFSKLGGRGTDYSNCTLPPAPPSIKKTAVEGILPCH